MEDDYHATSTNKADKIIDTWMKNLDQTKTTGQESISNMCGLALKSLYKYKGEITQIEDELADIDKQLQQEEDKIVLMKDQNDIYREEEDYFRTDIR